MTQQRVSRGKTTLKATLNTQVYTASIRMGLKKDHSLDRAVDRGDRP